MFAQSVKSVLTKWLFFVATAASFVVIVIVGLQVGVRYGYETDQTSGHTIRLDHLTGERCAYSGSDRLVNQLGIPRCRS